MMQNNKKAARLLEVLNLRERQVSYFISQGLMNEEIGEKLGIHKTTVAIYVHEMLGKLRLRNRVEVAVMVAISGMKKPSMKKPKGRKGGS